MMLRALAPALLDRWPMLHDTRFFPDLADPNSRGASTGTRYDLGRALGIVRAMDTSPTRAAVFDEIKSKNRVVWLADSLYARADARLTRRLILAAYMLKSVASFGPAPGRDARAVTVAGFANEVHAIDRVAALLPDTPFAHIRAKRSNLTARGQGAALLATLGLIGARWRYLGRLARRHDFMPACRIASTLAAYARFGAMLDAAPRARAAIVASNYSPDALGLSAAAHKAGRRVVYVNHAPVPQNSPYVPPVHADCAFFNGAAIHDTYKSRSRCDTHPVFIGQEGATARMRLTADAPRTVGIFLTALTRKDTLTRLVSEIRTAHPDAHILIRHHPVALLKTDLTELEAETPNLTVTIGTPLDGDIAACDAVICGNSGVILNTLRGGRPVAYLPALDELPLDYNGFLAEGLVPRIDAFTAETHDMLTGFYDRAEWTKTMRRFDASYLRPAEDLAQAARQTLMALLALQPSATIPASNGVPRATSRPAVLPSTSS
ncbi:hypothetical protein [Kangsaoukella pontilimi]|nr:hypothetical protein [Kangsaoukella pontilimi]